MAAIVPSLGASLVATNASCADQLALFAPDEFQRYQRALADGINVDCGQVLDAVIRNRQQIAQSLNANAQALGQPGGPLFLTQQQQQIGADLLALQAGAQPWTRPIDAADDLARQACRNGWGNATLAQIQRVYERAEALGIPNATRLTLSGVCTALENVLDAIERNALELETAAVSLAPRPLAPYSALAYGQQQQQPSAFARPLYGGVGIAQGLGQLPAAGNLAPAALAARASTLEREALVARREAEVAQRQANVAERQALVGEQQQFNAAALGGLEPLTGAFLPRQGPLGAASYIPPPANPFIPQQTAWRNLQQQQQPFPGAF